MRIESVKYQVDKGGPWKRGVIINEGMGPLLDLQGQPVADVWDYHVDHLQVMTLEETNDDRQ